MYLFIYLLAFRGLSQRHGSELSPKLPSPLPRSLGVSAVPTRTPPSLGGRCAPLHPRGTRRGRSVRCARRGALQCGGEGRGERGGGGGGRGRGGKAAAGLAGSASPRAARAGASVPLW